MVRCKVVLSSGGTMLDSHYAAVPENQGALAPVEVPLDVKSEQLRLQDRRALGPLLGADQVGAGKRRPHFGRKNLSIATRALLWALRVYVVAMLVIVLISVYQAIHAAH